MIKRLIATFTLLICLSTAVLANQAFTIKLDQKNKIQRENLAFAYLTFEYLSNNGNNAIVRVSLENITQNPPLAVLLFNRNINENILKGGKPKFEFEKIYPGEKGKRMVTGTRLGYNDFDIVTPAETDTLFLINVPLSSPKNIQLPVYLAKYKPKDMNKKGKYNIKYKIREEFLYDIRIEVQGWNEEDPTYVETKNSVNEFITSINGVEFCNNKKHSPSLKAQQRPYQEKKDSLVRVINEILDSRSEWLSTDPPHKAYTKLLTELNSINLDIYAKDCGDHKIKPPKKLHNCSFCSLSIQGIYHRVDDIYQQLHSGKITKGQATKSANGLYNCLQLNKKRPKEEPYVTKITRFYNRIMKY